MVSEEYLVHLRSCEWGEQRHAIHLAGWAALASGKVDNEVAIPEKSGKGEEPWTTRANTQKSGVCGPVAHSGPGTTERGIEQFLLPEPWPIALHRIRPVCMRIPHD